MKYVSATAVLLALAAAPSFAQVYGKPKLLDGIGIDQKMGAQVPLDIPFADEAGQRVTLRKYLGKPVILALVYYQCPSLCSRVLSGVVSTVKGLPLTLGQDYEVVTVSFDPRDEYTVAAQKKANYMQEYGRAGADPYFHFLTGPETSSRALADAVGFHYAFDANNNQYVHPSTIILLTPEGRVARYFYGVNYPARDVKLGLVEASGGKIGSPVDQVLLYCFHYDPANGKYGFVIMNVLRVAGILTVGLLVGFMLIMFRRDLRLGRRAPRLHERKEA